jgi:hypothetical protein
MMKKVWMVGFAAVVLVGMTGAASADHAIGAGANYGRTMGELKDDPSFDRSGLSYYISYQYKPVPVFFLEAQVERMYDGFLGAPETVYAPQAYVGAKLLFLYGAVGLGKFYSDGEWANDFFYALRAGVDLTLLPFIHLDINANYRFANWSDLKEKDINTDAIMFGAAARFVF